MPNGNPFYIQPADIAGPTLRGLSAFTKPFMERGRVEAEKQQQQAMLKEISDTYQTGTPDEINLLSVKYPEHAQSILTRGKFKNEQTQQNYLQSLMRAYQNPEQIGAIAKSGASFLRSQGASEEEIARREQWEEKFKEDPERMKQVMLNEISFLADAEQWERFKGVSGISGDEEVKVGAQEILEDGTIIQSTAKGPIVYNPLGEKITGQAAADAVARGRAEKVANLRLAAGEKKTATLEAEQELKAKVEAGVINAKEAAKISVKAFDRLEKINTGIANIDEAIRLVDEGVETGAIKGRLPSIRANAIKLDNLQGRLGLDVIGNTTFGALSESELAFALSTALPKTLEGPELRAWLVEKKAAQEKLSDYIEASAIFLGTPGNTVADWMRQQRDKRLSTPNDMQPAPPALGAGGNAQGMSTEDLMAIALGGR